MTDPYKDAPQFADAAPVLIDGPSKLKETVVEMVLKHNAPGDTSDGYHTFDELYEHRLALTAVVATIAAIDGDSWRSKQHHPDDGPMFDGHFIVGIDLPVGQVGYHYPLKDWDCFAEVPVLEHAPKWDGHTSDDVLDRLHAFVLDLNEAIRTGRETQAAARAAADQIQQGVAFYDRHAVGVTCCRVDESAGADE